MIKRNENRPGYKKTKVGWIPEEWECVSIRDVAKVVTGSTPSTKNPKYYGSEFLFVGPADLDNGKYIFDSAKKLSRNGFNVCRKIPAGSTLFTCIGSTIGKVAIAGKELATNQQINAVISKNKETKEFLYYALLKLSPKIKSLASEQAVPIVNKSEFSAYKIPLPPLPEQKKIAEILSAWDRAIEQVGKLIGAKQRFKKGLMQQLLTGRMRFPEFGEPVKEKGKLPEGWREVRLGELCKITYGKDWKDVACSESAYPVYGTGGVIGYASSPLYSGPSILLGRKGTIDNPVYINGPFWAVDTTFYTEIKKEMDPKFIFFLFCCIHWRRYNEASGVPSLSRSTIEKIKLAIPSQPEQTRIAAVLSSCDREIELLRRKETVLREQKNGLMQKLLTGEVRHPDFINDKGISGRNISNDER